jgi:hypothetical protein
MRAAHVARNVTTQAAKDVLAEAADAALQRQVAEATRGLRVYVFVDISGSMEQSIEAAKGYLARFLQGFPAAQVHVAVFNTQGREVKITHASAAGVENAFRGIRAGGGTDYGAGVRALSHHKYIGQNVGDGASDDNVFLFVGDEEAAPFTEAVQASGLRPLAFGLLKVGGGAYNCVSHTAARLGIPCFALDERLFADAYAVPRALRALIASTPAVQMAGAQRQAPRKTLVEQILDTALLAPPQWV